ncbi:Prophage antirepressor [Mycoavidus cysteinexigens]|uniref:Prophage antirepressor n=1 Tax=Mycoavidus cysteinexigens TaxID=1553431 RepID=A0A2Z6EW62_9BURK|nr:phage antirepressor KilAC domain-containing protein [Mycoavidus cysteinexigens]BBE09697.1 Prophage antirepressor [Mycoavidus cysteinexigens]GAM51566.1 phage antirepressor protein [bacterium endosymbiont of Mortierella elongata FMR23-6]GLR01675.1 phage antirepressor KilAC domain-containing protein [Mycoavidus cysteinexigens]
MSQIANTHIYSISPGSPNSFVAIPQQEIDATEKLIAITPTRLKGRSAPTVNARNLHAFLGIGKDFSTWIKNRIAQYGFIEDQDFVLFPNFGENLTGGRPAKEYALTLDMAKELSMVERNEKGKQARQYFIECERRIHSPAIDLHSFLNDPKHLRTILLAYTEEVGTLRSQVEELKPKADFYDDVGKAINAQTVQEVAKVIGTGPKRLFSWLRERRLLMKNNLPYQEQIEAGRFRVIERQYEDPRGENHIYARTLVTGKGLTWIQKQFAQGATA